MAQQFNYLLRRPLLGFFLLLFAVNYHYQQKARSLADNLLRDQPAEWQRQVRTNAYTCFIRRGLWGLIFLAGFVLRLPAILAHGWHWLNLAGLLLGIALIGWGYIGFRSEMARLKPR